VSWSFNVGLGIRRGSSQPRGVVGIDKFNLDKPFPRFAVQAATQAPNKMQDLALKTRFGKDLITVLRRRLEVETRLVWQLTDCSSRPGGPAAVEDALVLTGACPQNEHVRIHQCKAGSTRSARAMSGRARPTRHSGGPRSRVRPSTAKSRRADHIPLEVWFATARTRPLLGRRRTPDSRS
jgi:hypothetical protein